MGERDTEPVIHNNSAATEEKMSSQSASIGVNLRVTGQCSQGGRKYMEDFFSVAYQRSENAKDLEYAFVGIYDGHGGSEAATFAKEHLMMEIINQKLFWSDCDHDVLRAIREGYIATHYAMWREQEKWPKTATGLPSTAGTTATVAFIRHQKIYIGHVGDSGIVLGYQNENENFWRARQLTQDHKPESQAEKARIMRSGGKVVVKSGVPRVVWNRPRIAGHKGPVRRNTPVDEIPFLAVARSLGDLWSYNSALNEFVVSPDPDVKVIKINPKTFRCLIFGTDGLWNVVSAQDAVDTVREKEMINERLTTMSNDSAGPGTSNNQWTNPSKGLVEKAIKTWSSKKMRADNTSVVTVILYPPGKNISDNSVRCQTHSYGLEYTQVNAEIPTLDDENFSQSSADKFLPPEEYRNYVYDEEDRDFDCHSCVNQYYSTTYAPLRQPSSREQPLPSSPEQTLPSFISTQNQHHPQQQQQQQRQHLLQQNYVGYYSGEDIRENCTTHNYMRTTCDDDDEEIDADDDGDGDDDDNGVDEDDYDEEGEIPINNVTINENHTYMNSFAESYNSLLTSSLERENSATSMTTNNSSSDGGYHTSYISLDIQRHQDLEIEQHQYQQQCMSDEEGYSLTKLETRGEQQLRCNLQPKINEAQNQIQTFQIYTNGEMDYPATYDGGQQQQQYNPAASETICNYSQVSQSFSYDNNSYLSNYEQTSNCYVAPNLELTSLLQQELEEEKLVEIERSRNMAKTITTEVVSLPESEYSVETIEDEEGEEEEEEGGGGEEGQGSVVTAIDAVYDANEMDTVVLDETIQINEISSSVLESPVSSPMDGDVENKSEEEEKDGLLQKVELNTNQCSSSTISSVEKLLPLTQSQSRQQPVAPPMTKLTTQIVCLPLPLPLPPTKVRSHFPNIPNENRTSSRNSNINGQFHKLSSHHRQQQQQQQQQQHQNGHQRYEKRQLRSTIIVDYTKRTLRSRNSLSKDMKAKSASSAVISKPLRLRSTGAASAAVAAAAAAAAAVEAQYQNFKPTSAVTTAAVSRIANVENRRIRQKSSSSLPSSSPQTPTTLSAPTADISAAIQHSKVGNRSVVSINLRSRQIVMPLLAAVVSQSSPVTASAIQQRQQRSGRNLSGVAAATAASNNANTRRVSVSSKSPNAKSRPQESTYSKTTRLQGATPNLTSPPPQPKIISNSMTMTRARSLLSPKSMSVSVFSKRSSLRNASGNTTNGGSESGTGLGINSVTVVAGNHQTKSRVQKRLRR